MLIIQGLNYNLGVRRRYTKEVVMKKFKVKNMMVEVVTSDYFFLLSNNLSFYFNKVFLSHNVLIDFCESKYWW